MNENKTVHLNPNNHDFLRRLAYFNRTSIQSETNKIITEKRKEKKEERVRKQCQKEQI